MDEEQNNTVNDTLNTENKGKNAAKSAKKGIKKGKSIIGKMKNIKLLAPLASILSSLGIIFLIIGFIGFFTTLPGLAVEKIIEWCKNFWDWVVASEKIQIDKDKLVDMAKYIEELGYSIEANGFASKNQIKRDENGEITEVHTDYSGSGDTPNYLYAYVLQNERIYSVSGVEKSGINKVLSFIPTPTGQLLSHVATAIEDSIRESDYELNKESYGMMHFDGTNKDWWNNVEDFKVEIDREAKKLTIKTQSGFLWLRTDQVVYDLDGWIGRYGKPIELSLALHLSTLAPDFVYDFCMDEELQTAIELSTQETKYNVDFYFVPDTNPDETITKEDVEAEYKRQIETMEVQKIHNVLFCKEHEITNNTWYEKNDEGYYRKSPPIDIMDSTSIYTYSPKDPKEGVVFDGRTYTLQESLFTNNNLNYFMLNATDGQPKIIPNLENVDNVNELRNQGLIFTLEDVINGFGEFKGVWITDNFELRIDAISMNDMFAIFNSTNYTAKRAVIKYLYMDAQCNVDKYSDYGFLTLMHHMDTTIKYVRENDQHAAFHDTSIGYEDTYKGAVKSCWEMYPYPDTMSDEEIDIIVNNLVEEFELIRKHINKDIDSLNYYTQTIIDANLSTIEEWGLSGEEFRLLYEIMVEQPSDIHTFIPYINKVTNHWYKDVYFIPEDKKTPANWKKAYDFTQEIDSTKKEYNPDGLANTEDIQKLQEKGKILYSLSPTDKKHNNEVKQIKQPYILKTEPWHNKVKNWLTSGYFFIYDGTIETAEEIESARKVLANKYNPENPLLIDDFDNKELLVDSDNNRSNRVEEIDARAKELNEILASTEYKEGKNYKVRLQKINFSKKSSLAAFSILEGVHTKDGEYVYRDLKEFMIELGYFSRGDFETIESNVLDWIIPEYLPDKWPNTRYEKNNSEYGTYIKSKASLANDDSSGSNNGETQNISNSSNEQNSTISTYSVKEKEVDASDYKEEGYNTITTINNISYKNYKQKNGNSIYSTYAMLKPSQSTDFFKNVGCGPTSTAIVLSAYGVTGKRGEDALPYVIGEEIGVTTHGTDSANNIKIAFDKRGIKTTVYNKSDANVYNIMDKALKEGRPIIANVNAGSYSRNGHYIAILGYDEDNKLVISNPYGYGLYGDTGTYNPGPVSLQDFISKHLGGGSNTFLIPDEAPNSNYVYVQSDVDSIEGFDPGLDVITPGQCIVTKLKRGDKSDTITIKFTSSNKVKDMTMKIEGVKINLDIEEGTTIDRGAVIGKTTDEDIKLLMRDSKKAIINNIEYYMQPRKNKKKNSSEGGTIPLFSTSLSRKEFIEGADNYSGITGTEFEGKMGEFYDICTDNGINPVVAFTKAIQECSLRNSNHNFWGLATPNGENTPQLADTMLGTLQVFCDTINRYQDPSSEDYKDIMSKYEERKNCTENGGISEQGYGTPDTLEGVASRYSYVGKHEYGGPGSGGYYYLDPERTNNKCTTIYATHEEFVSLCKNKHQEGSPTTVYEQGQYTAYQVKMLAEFAENIWGEEALK